MRNRFTFLLLSLVMMSAVFAQTESKDVLLRDEFGNIPLDDLMTRLDSYAAEARADERSQLLIRTYGNDGRTLATPFLKSDMIFALLVGGIGVEPSKIMIEHCEISSSTYKTRLFIVPNSVSFSKCEKNAEVPQKTVLFAEARPFFDGTTLTDLRQCVPQLGDESCNGGFSVDSLKLLKSFLDSLPNSKISVLMILGKTYEDGTKKRSRKEKDDNYKKMAANSMKILTDVGISPSQVVFEKGENYMGYQKYQFWFVPAGGKMPKPNHK